ncbi:uncharacterized protein DUF2470 [Herbihabitans rhizosphaerae]|uniref:Uncharacterized protein DUF2470 n=1 Tax=Herbihabitans rhizosphaerae TaxID=1872711 RepID=A0A4Q7KCI9_9PSEU|nr:DUF2470 domain-containing protein [Herbihabitans rhizosphaerae]RZS30345.1 uncharacterized protein DUF2470 [Herbihabitans rhizosphaerae]
MVQQHVQAPPVPTPAQRARTIVALDCPATLLPAGEDPVDGARLVPLLHHVHTDGSVSLLLPDDHELITEAEFAPRGEVAAMLELVDFAPVPLREPIRGLMWITGWLCALGAEQARDEASMIAESTPDPRLLDLGHGAAMLRLVPVSLVVADSAGTHSVAPDEFGHAEPDPFVYYESEWLMHLAHHHGDVVTRLARHLPPELRDGRIRPLGLDRLGMRLRVEIGNVDHDVRLSFSQPVDTPAELAARLRQMVGCPFVTR